MTSYSTLNEPDQVTIVHVMCMYRFLLFVFLSALLISDDIRSSVCVVRGGLALYMCHLL